MRFYSFQKSRRILRGAYKLFKRKGHKLATLNYEKFETDLRALDQALLSKEKEEASTLAKRVEAFVKGHFPKGFWDHAKEIVCALIFAIVVAFAIRQLWFELYQVPTGSMRPTVEELDRMVVSKTTFGIHIPFLEKQLFFNPDYIQRGGSIVFTVKDMDVPDPDTLYFHLFPGKKRYIKRGVTKPGDTIYFYGGRIYSVDRQGNPIMELADEAFLKENGMEKIDHIPYITFDGKVQLSRLLGQNVYGTTIFKQMNTPVGKLQVKPNGEVEGRFFDGKQWVLDRPDALKTAHDKPVSYSDLWGMGNYAMARLLTREQVELFYDKEPRAGIFIHVFTF